MLKPTSQDPRKYRVAAFNARLHRNSIHPGNHDVNYHNGWYYLDGEPRQAPDITRRAKELEDRPDVHVFFHDRINSYVLVPVGPDGRPQRGSVHV